MAIAPISGVKFNNSVSFKSKGIDYLPKEDDNLQKSSQKANGMVTIPTALFIALATTALTPQTKANTIENDEAIANTEMITQAPGVSKTLYAPDPENLEYAKRFAADGKNFTMYYINYFKSPSNPQKQVHEVQFVEDGFKEIKRGSRSCNTPWKLKEVIYHDLGDPDNKDFIGVFMTRRSCDENGQNSRFEYKEMRVPDNIGMDLIHLIDNKTFKCFIAQPRYGEVNGATLKQHKVVPSQK